MASSEYFWAIALISSFSLLSIDYSTGVAVRPKSVLPRPGLSIEAAPGSPVAYHIPLGQYQDQWDVN